MRNIIKKGEPSEFSEWKKKNREYKSLNEKDNYKIKKIVKENLLNEQFFVCCYCEKRVDVDNSTIEHLKTQSKYSKLQLDYNNLMASCNIKSHCNQKRGNTDISINPLQDKNINKEFKYILSLKGRNPIIKIKSEKYETDIESLGLNDLQLERQRGKALQGLISEKCYKFNVKDLSEDEKKEIANFINKANEGKLQEFVSSLSYILENI